MRGAVVLMVAAAAAVVVPGAARAQDGASVFRRQCGVCHATQAGQTKTGPSMAGIVGKKAGQVAGFDYSDANKSSSVVWTEDNLEKYLADPKGFMPGTKMVYAGLKNPDDAKAVVDYLKTLK